MWDGINWTLASQITSFFELSAAGSAAGGRDDAPKDFFAALREAGALDDALSFLAFALPRRGAIAWGYRCVGASARHASLLPADMGAYSAVGAWLDDASEERRSVAESAAKQAGYRTPEAMLALSVFVSGGSLAAPASPQQVPAPPELAGQMVNAALVMASTRVGPKFIGKIKSDFLDFGVQYAEGSVDPSKRLDPGAWSEDVPAHAPNAENREPIRPPQRPAPRPRP